MESYTWSVLILTNNEDSIFLKIFCSLFRVGCSISFFPSQVEGYVRFSHNSARRHPPEKFKVFFNYFYKRVGLPLPECVWLVGDVETSLWETKHKSGLRVVQVWVQLILILSAFVMLSKNTRFFSLQIFTVFSSKLEKIPYTGGVCLRWLAGWSWGASSVLLVGSSDWTWITKVNQIFSYFYHILFFVYQILPYAEGKYRWQGDILPVSENMNSAKIGRMKF